MKKIKFIFILACFIFGSLLRAQEKSTLPTGWTPEEMMKVKDVGNVQVSPDGSRVVFTVTEAVMTADRSEYLTHIHMANADGSNVRQLTYGDNSCTSPQWSPDGHWLAFTTNRSGRNNLYLISSDGGEAQLLTDVRTGVSAFEWAPDSKQIAFVMPDSLTAAEEKDQRGRNDARVIDENFKMNRLWVIPVEKDAGGRRTARLLTSGAFSIGTPLSGTTSLFDWSPDSETIAFTHFPTPRAEDGKLADISTVDVATGTVTPMVHTDASEVVPLYSPDGRWIAYRTSLRRQGQDVIDVFVVAASGGTPRKLAETFNRSPYFIGWSADVQRIYIAEKRGTVTRLSALPVNGDPPEDIDRGDSVISIANVNLNRSRTMVGFAAQTSTSPPEAYIARLDNFAPVQVSRANADLPNYPLGRTDVIQWKSSDGMEIEGLLTYPVAYQPGIRYPLLVIIHGGPAGVFSQTFITLYSLFPSAVFAAQGYAVLRCNVRGSTGYGDQFRSAN
ncbi:S9 family peptidase, partial [Candidatus Latescibacterota bacterium]